MRLERSELEAGRENVLRDPTLGGLSQRSMHLTVLIPFTLVHRDSDEGPFVQPDDKCVFADELPK